MLNNAINALKVEMSQSGIETEAEIIADAEFHTFDIIGDPEESKKGWYVLYCDGIPRAAPTISILIINPW